MLRKKNLVVDTTSVQMNHDSRETVMKIRMLVILICAFLFQPLDRATADCTGCVGDYSKTSVELDIWGDPGIPDKSTHMHEFGAVCDATNLAGFVGEVHIQITVVADLAGASKYVTANFISGLNVTAIKSVNGFVGAPKDGKFFVGRDGQTGCVGEENTALVQLDYDDFNALLAAGDGTVEIEVTVSSAVEDLCEICCESGHGWTPDACCESVPPCSCPPNVVSKSEVTLLYLDCDVFGEPFECTVDGDCDDSLYCTGVETCDDGACVAPGNPCLASGKICKELFQSCGDCVSDAECQQEDGLVCNGQERCVNGTCQAGTSPCSQGEECREPQDDCVIPVPCVPCP